MEVKLKLLLFSFVLLVMQKVQNMDSVDIESDWKTTCKKRTDSSSLFTCNGKIQKGRQR